MKSKIAVIIPFYQIEKGILIRAVKSALSQKNISNFEVIIVDDGSPISAKDELMDQILQHPNIIRIIKQKNAGPGAARNKGLEHVSKDVTYIAFLDSDDEWAENHLHRALSVLDKGYDLYFSDFHRVGTPSSFFQDRNMLEGYRYQVINDSFFEISDMFFDSLIKKNIIGTSTVLYRFEKFPTLRFSASIYNGEDDLFWLNLAMLAKKAAFSKKVEAYCGHGVNICISARWDSDAGMAFLRHSQNKWKRIAETFDLSPAQKKFVNSQSRNIRTHLVANFLNGLKNMRPDVLEGLFRYIRTDIWILPLLPYEIIKICFLRTAKKS